MIKIITIGSIKEKYLKEAIDEYKKRISKYTKLEIIELKDEGLVEEEKAKKLEAEKINRYINERNYIITLEIEGKEYNSVELEEKAKLHLSFSKLTFPHQLFRVLLLEQIYRSFKINNNEKYHK